jgi:hypothetical protein
VSPLPPGASSETRRSLTTSGTIWNFRPRSELFHLPIDFSQINVKKVVIRLTPFWEKKGNDAEESAVAFLLLWFF